jgi:catechol 2,3-dioxygenase-like lactoylglutathione lyase family enzyme
MATMAPPRIILGLHHVQISVPESMEDAALRFYTDVLGFIPIDKPKNGRDRGPHCLQVGGLEVHLATEEGVNRRTTKAHIAYRVDDLAYWRKRMLENDVTPVDTPAVSGFERFEARDPFGNRIEFIQRIG